MVGSVEGLGFRVFLAWIASVNGFKGAGVWSWGYLKESLGLVLYIKIVYYSIYYRIIWDSIV